MQTIIQSIYSNMGKKRDAERANKAWNEFLAKDAIGKILKAQQATAKEVRYV